MQDIRQSKLWKKYGATKGWKVVDLPSSDGQHCLQAIVFPIGIFGLNFLKLQRAEYDPDWSELKKIKRKYWVVSSIIEPARIESEENYKKNGYRLSNFPYLATKTVIVDLEQPESELWKKLSENTKRLVLKNKDLEIKEVSPKMFLEYWKVSSKIWTMKLDDLENLKKSLGKKVSFLLSFKKDVCQSGLLTVESKDVANYFHTFTTVAGRMSGAHFAMVWRQILAAKKRGLKYFDFEGIYDSRWPQKRWVGFTSFKNKFGGDVVTFPGCFHKWL